MNYLLDTNAFSDLVREHAKVQARRASAITASDRVCICSVVRGEVLFGIGRLAVGAKRQQLEARALQFFAMLPCEAIPAAAADRYAGIKLARADAGRPMGDNDLWIAAAALSLNAILVTRDADFRQIRDLAVRTGPCSRAATADHSNSSSSPTSRPKYASAVSTAAGFSISTPASRSRSSGHLLHPPLRKPR